MAKHGVLNFLVLCYFGEPRTCLLIHPTVSKSVARKAHIHACFSVQTHPRSTPKCGFASLYCIALHAPTYATFHASLPEQNPRACCKKKRLFDVLAFWEQKEWISLWSCLVIGSFFNALLLYAGTSCVVSAFWSNSFCMIHTCPMGAMVFNEVEIWIWSGATLQVLVRDGRGVLDPPKP